VSSTEPQRQKLSAALEQLEAEQRRREDEKVANGEAVRRPLYVVAHNGEPVADLIEHAKAREVATLRAQGDQRTIYFEEPLTIRTGVPRSSTRLVRCPLYPQ
jgi:hypothetical protein